MRSEKEMYALILEVAEKDDRIRAVYMNGSRTNPNVPKDRFQDYDIVYVAETTKSFIEDKDWIKKFGEILYMQYPDENPFCLGDKENTYGWLMQFADGNRLDLHIETVSYAAAHITEDKLCRVLLDKENILPQMAEATDVQYRVKLPDEAQYLAVCNEFWWCTNNLAKGLWRKEILYVQDMAGKVVRKQLIRMLDWKVGISTNWSVSTGKSSKYLYRWLSKEEWKELLATYFGGDVEEAWQAVFRMCDLFSQTAQYVGERLGYSYNRQEGEAARGYLEEVYHSRNSLSDCRRDEWNSEIKGSVAMIGKKVTVIVDRPMGTFHPEHKDIFYPINYGYIEGIIAPDGEEQDAYLVGLDKPVQEFTGIIIAIIHRYDDVEEKWVVAPEGMAFTENEIEKQTHFQEQYFQSEIRM